VAIHRKYEETKWVDPENGSRLRPKLQEARQKVLRDFCLLTALAFGKENDVIPPALDYLTCKRKVREATVV
jgi:hypothetical protein